ncbi:MAG: type III PLP-dependent enzyme [Pseudomonadota bacterium]
MFLDVNERAAQGAPTAEPSSAAGAPAMAPAPVKFSGYETTVDVLCAHRPQHPVLCFSQDILSAEAKRFLTGFPGEVSYAVKANDSAQVLNTLVDAGLEVFDVASLEEMAMVRAVLPDAVFHYHNPVKSRIEIETAYRRYGVRQFAFDDAGELAKLVDICKPEDTTLVVRFRLEESHAVHDFSTKFGASQIEAVTLLRAAHDAGFACALTFHPGSQCFNPEAYSEHIAAAAKISLAAGVELMSLNVGGGFPAAYAKNELPALETYFETIGNAADLHFKGKAPPLACEPGRAMVGSCMSLLVAVKHVRPQTGEVFLQDGIYGTLMEFSQTSLRPAVRLLRNGTECLPPASFQIYGPTCDPLDRLPGEYDLPADIREGDYLEFATMGAYSTATATRFNGYGDVKIVPVREPYQV